MDIRILPGNVANMIAAGEVVQRPSSVVKELLENSVDAGADQVSVVITDSGRTLIQVIDNGCGMNPDEAVLCFERHATSKITSAEDLENIRTFGFRGEALASIAAVAEVTMKTRREENEIGCQVEFADSKHLATLETACPKGTNIAVRNIFYNIPARRKFLKSDNVEFKHIIEEFTRVALTRPKVGFTLTHNNKDVFVLRQANSLKFRIQDLLGNIAVDKVVELKADTTVVDVSGYIGRPDMATKSLGNQFFFVNGRYFRSPYLHKAVMKAYEGIIPEGVTPSYFIYLEVPPGTMDVNIHPSKTEIKFEEDSVIFQVLYACVKESLGRHSFGASIDFDNSGVPEMPVFGSGYKDFRPDVNLPKVEFDPTFNPFEQQHTASNPSVCDNEGRSFSYSGFVDRRDDYGKLFEEKTLPVSSIVILHGKYIVTQVKSGLLVINIKRAKERILYDKFLGAINANGHVSQKALFPVQVVVGVENRLIFEEHSALLSSLGFDITAFGNDTIVVNGVPEGFSLDEGRIETLMADILLALNDNHHNIAGIMESGIAERFARIGSEGGPAMTSPVEAQRLIDNLFSSSNSEFTSKGNRIMNILSLDEIEKRF
ncbi:MAG: DNA mismatch repair endonuclease MutL [Candidatus Cryptobacteroides sp.]